MVLVWRGVGNVYGHVGQATVTPGLRRECLHCWEPLAYLGDEHNGVRDLRIVAGLRFVANTVDRRVDVTCWKCGAVRSFERVVVSGMAVPPEPAHRMLKSRRDN